MDIMANYYSVKNRVMRRFNPPSDWKVFSYKASPANEAQRIRVNEMRRQDTIEQHERLITRLNHEVEHLKEIVLTQDKAEIPRSNLHDAHAIINRLKGDINTEFYNYYDTLTTPEERRLYHAMLSGVKSACNNLDTEISEIESGIQDSIAREEST